MNEPKQTQQLNTERRLAGWTQLTMFDEVTVMGPRLIAIRSALRCPMCGSQLQHVIGERCECPRCGMELDL